MGMTRLESVLYGLFMRVFLPGDVWREYGDEVRETFAQLRHQGRA